MLRLSKSIFVLLRHYIETTTDICSSSHNRCNRHTWNNERYGSTPTPAKLFWNCEGADFIIGYVHCCSKRKTRKINNGSKFNTFFIKKNHFEWLKTHHISIDIRINLAKHTSLQAQAAVDKYLCLASLWFGHLRVSVYFFSNSFTFVYSLLQLHGRLMCFVTEMQV